MNKLENPLQLPAINVVVAGNGGIASAMIQQLLADYPVQRLFCLQRNSKPVSDDARVVSLTVDATDPASIGDAVERIVQDTSKIHLVINTIGMLHAPGIRPEKRMQDIEPAALSTLMSVNASFLVLLANALSGLLRHNEPAVFASLSARVGSITDNSLGGWYSYRASKAAHNMLLKTLSREWSVSRKNVCLLALHPGTVATRLSEPFVTESYRKRVLTPAECASALLQVMALATARQTGSFLSWEGEVIPW